jgi:hypothetical protein
VTKGDTIQHVPDSLTNLHGRNLVCHM